MQKFTTTIDPTLIWLDIIDPSTRGLKQIAKEYGLHPTSVEDCLDPTHLPKHEKIGPVTFIIVRGFDETAIPDADTVQEITRKIAIFVGQNFVITVHRKDQPFMKTLRDRWQDPTLECTRTKSGFLSELMSAVIYSYDRPIDQATTDFEALEEQIFKPTPPPDVIERGYYLKRKASVFKRMLRMTSDLLPKISAFHETPNGPMLQDLKEGSDSLFFYADELSENLNNLLNLHVSLSSQKTNEVVRILTIFSVFFLPLNLIAGVYGMNFEHMPELKHVFGYPTALAGMFLVAAGIYFWFKKKGWLQG